jgi:hypothetical protein
LWHERVEGEPSHDWLHEILRRAAEDLRHGPQGIAASLSNPHRA